MPLVYLDNAATTQRPRQVIQALVDVYEQQYANVHRGIHWLSDQSTDLYEQAREKVRRVHQCPGREEVIFTHGTTESINLVARSWGDANVRPGDEILLTEMEHHSNIVPWQQLAARTGGRAAATCPSPTTACWSSTRCDELLDERTRLVAVTAVSNVLGTINPVERIDRRRACRPGRWCWSTPPKACRTCRPTCRRWGPTSSPSAGTRCWARLAWACCTAGASCWTRCRRFWAAAA